MMGRKKYIYIFFLVELPEGASQAKYDENLKWATASGVLLLPLLIRQAIYIVSVALSPGSLFSL